MEFSNDSLEHFWVPQLETYSLLPKRALAMLVPFTTTYLSKTGFCCLPHIKTKSRNRLDAQHDMHITLSTKI